MKSTKAPLVTAAELRSRAEAAFLANVAASPEIQMAPTPDTTEALLHELQVHQIELEMQNDELRRSQLELEASRATYFDLYELAPVGYCTVAENGQATKINLALASLLGVARRALVGQLFSRLILAEDQDAYYLLKRQVLASHGPGAEPAASAHSCEVRLNHSSGTPVWVSLVATAATEASGETVLRVAATDISARRAREAADRLEAQTQLDILNAIPAHVALVDPEGVILATNESWRRFATANLLQGPEFSIGQNYLKVCERATGPCSEEARDAAAGIGRVLRGEVGAFTIEYPCHSPTEQRWFRLEASPLRAGRGGAVVMHINITERKSAETALRESGDRLVEALAVAKMGSWETNLSTREARWSDELYRVFGIGPPSFTATHAAFLGFVHPEDRAAVDAAFLESFDRDSLNAIEHRIITASGLVKSVEERWRIHHDEQGRPVRAVGTCQDITERTRAEADKAALRTQLQQAQKLASVGRLAGGVAHEFNNMLGVILGCASIAMDRVDLDQSLQNDLEEIRTAATRAAEVTRELLAFARKQVIVPSVLDLNEAVGGTMKMLGRLIGENVQLTWQPAADLWPIKADPTQIGQVLTNLCLNARDAIADTGHLTIETGNTTIDEAGCAVHPEAVPGQYVFLVASDDGCGMDQETLAQVFEPFFTTKDVGKGTGLGLPVVQGIVLQHGGFVTVSSKPGVGTTFRIYFPRHAETTVEIVPPAAVAMPDARGETILVVEDEPALLKLTARLLERRGYTVLAAPSPGEALRLGREHAGEIHLLLTDVLMPEMNGQELVRQFVALRPTVTILFMSGYADAVIAEQRMLVAATSFLPKPFTAHALAVAVRQGLDRDQPRLG